MTSGERLAWPACLPPPPHLPAAVLCCACLHLMVCGVHVYVWQQDAVRLCWPGLAFHFPTNVTISCGAPLAPLCHSLLFARLAVSVTDFGIRVLAMPSGQQLHYLSFHTSEQPLAALGCPVRCRVLPCIGKYLCYAGASTAEACDTRPDPFLWPFLCAACCPLLAFPCTFHPAGHVHILEFHPTNPCLAFSASYDGSLVVWDAASGAVLRRFSRCVRLRASGETCRILCLQGLPCTALYVLFSNSHPPLPLPLPPHPPYPLPAAAARPAPTAAAGQTCFPLLTATLPPMAPPSASLVSALLAAQHRDRQRQLHACVPRLQQSYGSRSSCSAAPCCPQRSSCCCAMLCLPADVAGQLHRYALGPPCSLLALAPYDQFLTTDYNVLLRDLQHNVVDAETQLPPHVLTGKPCLLAAGPPWRLGLAGLPPSAAVWPPTCYPLNRCAVLVRCCASPSLPSCLPAWACRP